MRRAFDEAVFASLFAGLARRIGRADVRRLFARFCHEVARLSDGITLEMTSFDLTLREPCGFSISVTPLKELFLVSIGENRALDIRVSSVDGFASALDLAVNSYLGFQSKIPSA
jgi:hypothetical protein